MTAAQAEGYAKERERIGIRSYAGVLTEADKKSLQALNVIRSSMGLVKQELPLESLFVKEAFNM